MDTLSPDITFDSVGGLDEIIETVKDMILLPMRFRQVSEAYGLKRNRGVLFHGPPGTGKTLVAGALANECSSWGKKFSFFTQKGSDILNKYLGESEKNIKNLFEKAFKARPSIIFFDELDGLAPPRSDRTDDNSSTSVVSTLLAYMDGIGKSSEIFIIGATNRIDRIDPALRRPGRFDKELYFPLPCCKAREAILKVHTTPWPCKPSEDLITFLARETSGYCGADLQSLCSSAVMHCLKKAHPNIYQNTIVNIDPRKLKVTREDFLRAQENLVPASQRSGTTPTKKLANFVEPLCWNIVDEIIRLLSLRYPAEVMAMLPSIVCRSDIVMYPRLLLTGTASKAITSHIAPALLHHFEHLPVYTLDEIALFKDGRSIEASIIEVLLKASKNLPGVLFLPNMTNWWIRLGVATRTTFFSLMEKLFLNKPLMVIATLHVIHHNLVPQELQSWFSTNGQGQIALVRNPDRNEREHFFFPLFNLSSTVALPALKPLAIIDLVNPQNNCPSPAQPASMTLMMTGNATQPVPRSSRRHLTRNTALKRRCLDKENPKAKKLRRDDDLESAPVVEEIGANHISNSDGVKLTNLLGRLVNATDEWEIRWLEVLYGIMRKCFTDWSTHGKMDVLLNELEYRVCRVEAGHKFAFNDDGEIKVSQTDDFKFSQTQEFKNQNIKSEFDKTRTPRSQLKLTCQ